MKPLVLCLLSFALTAGADEPPMQTDGEIWNEGVGYYEQGDVTNALLKLKPLMLSKSHGPRAAEVVAKLEYDGGNLEEAASAAQIALRANPADERLNRNFTRATDRLPEQREAKRLEAILKAAQGKDPGSMLHAATRDARELLALSGGVRTNAAAKAVALADSLSRRAEKLADTWVPVREIITQSVTNEEQAATILAQLNAAEAKTKKAATELGDLNPDAFSTLSDVEHDFTRFLKLTILPPAAMDEDGLAQSNAWQDVETVNGRPWQPEALDYTRAFRSKFPAWARAYEQQAQADTNRPPFTAEDQARVSALATELEKIQLECTEKSLPPSQEKALRIIEEIRKLLPKEKNGGGQGQPQSQPQNQDREKQDQQDQQQPPQQDQQTDQRQDQDPSESQQEDEQKEPERKSDEEKTEAEQQAEQEIEATLNKAKERNDEHEADKKARMRKAPLPPNERDW